MGSTNGHGTRHAVTYTRVSGPEQKKKGFSLSDQRDTLRAWCEAEGYEVIEEAEDGGWSGAELVRPGLDRVRDLVAAGGVDVVVSLNRNRIARDVYVQLLEAEFAEYATKLIALNSQGDDSPDGELSDGLMDVISGWQRKKTAHLTRRGKLRRAREGKILPVRRVKYGFKLNDARDGYEIDEDKMPTVRRIFHMVGVQGMSHNAIKRTFDEVAAVVSTEVASRLDKSKHYGLWWFNRLSTKTKQVSEAEPSGNGRVYKKQTHRPVKPKDEWIAVPVPDSGIPREIVDAARERIKQNRAPSKAGRRFWELSRGVIYCGGCDRRMGHHSVRARSKKYHYHYYRCPGHNQHLEDCPQAINLRADEIEPAVWRLVSELERLARGLDEMIDREREEARGNPDQQAKLWAGRIAEADRKRARFQDMAAEGLLTFDELRTNLARLDEDRKVADWELNNLQYRRERIAQLKEDKARLLDSFAGIMPEAAEKVTGEKRQQIYNLLRLRVTVEVGGDVEVSGAIVDAVCITGDQPLSIPGATGFSSSGSRAGAASSPSITWGRRPCSGDSRPGTGSSLA
jgi:site-specific DNA recombinase